MVRTLIGTRIRERRRAIKITQLSLARAVGISPSYLNLIEHNRRGIAGRTLLALAAELQVDAAELADGADSLLVNQLAEIANAQETAPEMDHTEEFIGRYPGWAKLLATLGKTNQVQRENLSALTDRMNHDPFLSETMHQILSNITVIRSTAGILDTTPDISETHQRRFLKNIRSESRRLSATAQAMVDFFDAPQQVNANNKPTEDTAGFWEQNGFFLAELERDGGTLADFLAQLPAQTATGSDALRQSIFRYRDMALKLPLDSFLSAAKSAGFDPLQLSKQFETPVGLVLWRLAHLPNRPDIPRFGMIECDISGAVLARKEIPEFSLPQFASACPLWPVYRSFGAVGQPIKAVLEMPTGVQVATFSISQTTNTDRYDMPPLLSAMMVFSAAPDIAASGKSPAPPILAGLHCSVCPRKNCPQRRTDYILS